MAVVEPLESQIELLKKPMQAFKKIPITVHRQLKAGILKKINYEHNFQRRSFIQIPTNALLVDNDEVVQYFLNVYPDVKSFTILYETADGDTMIPVLAHVYLKPAGTKG